MEEERSLLDELVPGLDDKLAGTERQLLESPDSPGLDFFRAADGPGLLVPRAWSGQGATAVQAVAAQAAIGSRSGSLAIATTMHHFSMASLIALSSVSDSGLEALLVEAVATQRHLLASGFAEGRPGTGILSPSMLAVSVEGGVRVSGTKKPCSLSRSMTMFTASTHLDEGGDGAQPGAMAVLLVPAGTSGLRTEAFWRSPVLAGAESHAVVLDDVFVPDDLVLRTQMRTGGALDTTHRTGFLWFELLMTASYLGVAAGLVEEAMQSTRAAAAGAVAAWGQVRTTSQALSRLAGQLDDGRCDDRLLAEVLLTRFQLQDGVPALVAACLEAIGGMVFISSEELAHRVASLHCLAFHPPSRSAANGALRALHGGGPLTFD